MTSLSMTMAYRDEPLGGAAELDRCLAELASGDSGALESLYHSTSSAIHSYALSILRNAHDAEDVLHDCYLNIYAGAEGYRSSGKPMAWILTIAKNLCLKQLRSSSRMEALPEQWQNSPESAEMTAEDKVVLRQCMEALSDTERQILVLHAVSGFKHREIAACLELPLPTVLSKYHRAIKKMKTKL